MKEKDMENNLSNNYERIGTTLIVQYLVLNGSLRNLYRFDIS
jgi:hypothetical protein